MSWRGPPKTFRRRAIRFVTFEFGGCNIDTRTFLQDFYYFFTHQGMRIARITPTGFSFEISKYNEIYGSSGQQTSWRILVAEIMDESTTQPIPE